MLLLCNTANGSLDRVFNQADYLPQQPLSMSELYPFNSEQRTPRSVKSGKLVLKINEHSSRLQVVKSDVAKKQSAKILPEISFSWVSNEKGEVIPKTRHLILTDNPNWDYFVGVGAYWPFTKNQLSTRISLPFTLVEKNENCVHNGILVIETESSKHANRFYYQISSETCAYFKADFWGSGRAEHSETTDFSTNDIITEYANEKSHRLPTLSLQELSKLNTNIDVRNFGLPNVVSPTDMSAFGVLYKGTHYASNCSTRSGDYPFCDQLVLPSYSTAKSLFAGLTMMMLEKRFGDVFNQPVSRWVKECNGKNWQGVTFAHLLDMSTGNFDSTNYAVDEAAPEKLAFFMASKHVERVKFACEHYTRQTPPGTKFVYHSSDTYLLGLGLNNFIKAKIGENTDIFSDILAKDVFQPLELSPITARTRRTQDDIAQPYAGYGLFFNRDDFVRLAAFIQHQASLPNTKSTLSTAYLHQALQMTPENRGMTTDYPFIRYQHSFWARKVESTFSCKTDKWIPFMSGYGGITLALLENNTVYYYVSDSYQFNWTAALTELNKIDAVCAD